MRELSTVGVSYQVYELYGKVSSINKCAYIQARWPLQAVSVAKGYEYVKKIVLKEAASYGPWRANFTSILDAEDYSTIVSRA